MPPKRKTIQLRVTPEQHERIRNKARAKGFATVSAYIRSLALEKDLLFEQRFEEVLRKGR
jgi:predicted DNA binding CopG/RHH family protein